MSDMEEMGAGLPEWLTTLAWAWIFIAVVSAALVANDIFRRGHRQHEPLMDFVWPLAALYLGPLAWPVYRRLSRTAASADVVDGTPGAANAAAARSGLPGGVASGLAHVVAVPFVVATGLTIAGLDMWAMVAIITVLATGLIFAFEYVLLHRHERGVGAARVKLAAALALATVVAFDLGMLGWMLVLHYSENMPAAGDVRFTFLMQVGLVLGSITAFPVMRWLVARGSSPAL